MFKVKFLIIVLSLNILSSFADEIKLSLTKDSKGENSTFVATEEWQEIKPGKLNFFKGILEMLNY